MISSLFFQVIIWLWQGTFYATVNGKPSSFFVEQLFVFQTMGISMGAGKLTANATVSNFLFNNYLEGNSYLYKTYKVFEVSNEK